MCQHLLRHISRIHVQNFTPFPARDAVASALTQPSEQSQFTPYGSLSDDLDVALARKRSRRLSSSSIMTVKSQGFEDNTNEESRTFSSALLAEQRVRKRTVSRVSAREFSTSVGSGSHPPLSGTGMTSKTNRPRTLSINSSNSGKGMVPTINLCQGYTQKTLENVLQSRLVETFITITVPSSIEQSASPAQSATSTSPSSRDRQSSPRASLASKSKLHSPQSSLSRSTLSSRDEQHSKHISRTRAPMPTEDLAPTSGSPNRRSITSPAKLNGNASKSASISWPAKTDPETRTVPNFISTIHRPSTNPQFALDFNDFSKWTDPSATHMTVQLWAKLRPDPQSLFGNDKGKERVSGDVDISNPQWRTAGKWDMRLADLVPLPDEVSSLQLQ